MFSKVLIANRGEIAVRIIRTCKELDVATVAVYSPSDASSLHVRTADESVALPPGPAADNYLSPVAIIDAAIASGAEAIHPGYGFLSENADFARAVGDAGLVFIGPSPDAISTMGEKVAAREVAILSDVPLAPGINSSIVDPADLVKFGDEHGYPILVKASHGGGGRGMREITTPDEAPEALSAAIREATAAFGNGEVYVERYLTDARHVEVQVFGDDHGNVVWLGDRDCSVQRRHQKLVEEAPAPGLSPELRVKMGEAAVRLARHVAYSGAGTVEFLVDGDKFYFLEMNTRIQVEHPVTEAVLGVDLVAEQLRVASGEPLSFSRSGPETRGAAIEARINAENVDGGRFTPSPGVIGRMIAPTGEGIRFDRGYESGDEVLPLYDSLVGKLVAWGKTRDEAILRLRKALDELVIDGVPTTVPAAMAVLDHPDFQNVEFSTLWLEKSVRFPEALSVEDDQEIVDRSHVYVGDRLYTIPFFGEGVWPAPQPAPDQAQAEPRNEATSQRRRPRRRAAQSSGRITAPMQGTVSTVHVAVGDRVILGQVLFVVEAMKMENPVRAPFDGVVDSVSAAVGDTPAAGSLLAELSEVPA